MPDFDPTAIDDESLAVEADDEVNYTPDSDSAVVAVEPRIITIGRKRKKDDLRKLQEPGF